MTTSKNNVITVKEKMTWSQYVASEYPTLECANFGREHLMDQQITRWSKYDPEVYIAEMDPKRNYGLNFKVYLRYKADGIMFFKAISYGSSCLSNAGFRSMVSFMFCFSTVEDAKEFIKCSTRETLQWNDIIMSDDSYANDSRTRAFFRRNDYLTATTEF